MDGVIAGPRAPVVVEAIVASAPLRIAIPK
jgi:hypothetical protein